MHCTRKITDDLTWVGANDRRLAMFEGVYSVPRGVSYNSYLLADEKTVLFDTVDNAVHHRFLENLVFALDGRALDYIVVQHVEPDHSSCLEELLLLYPDAVVVCNEKSLNLIYQFYSADLGSRVRVVKEGDTLGVGKHELQFIMAPMVHWPEVMVSYDKTDKILFSADAFGCFGATNGALFADEVDFERDYMFDARRYYSNIVGKYGTQVKSLLSKATMLEISMICPLHGFVWRQDMHIIVSKYTLWSEYAPEEHGVLIAYASVYGNTENAAEILACRLRVYGIKTAMFDVSVTPSSEILSEAFRWSHLVLASTTYNAGIFVAMDAFLDDLVAHNFQNRTVAIIENGSWAPTSGCLIREMLAGCKNLNVLDATVTLLSSLKASQIGEIDALAEAIRESFPAGVFGVGKATADAIHRVPTDDTPDGFVQNKIEPQALFRLSYGLFVLTAKDTLRDNGCIINTVAQLTSSPIRISITVNKANYTHQMVEETGEFNVSVLTESAPFAVFQQFGFQSGKDANKFASVSYSERTANGIRYVPLNVNAVISGKVINQVDCGTHTLFIADVTEAFVLSEEKSVTYQYYMDKIKPKPKQGVAAGVSKPKGYVCRVCGYVYEGETLPSDFICPLCKHGAEDFDKL